MTRLVAYALILNGIYLVGDAAYDEHRGIAEATSPEGLISVSPGRTYLTKRGDDPRGFRSLMTYEWIEAAVVLCGGLAILGLCRQADGLDPFSPHFAGNSALDELNQKLMEEEEKRHRPLK